MHYEISDQAGTIVVALSGRMELGRHKEFRTLTDTLEEIEATKIVLELSSLEFLDSSGLGMLIVLRNLAERRKLDFALRKPNETVRRILESAHFTELARIED